MVTLLFIFLNPKNANKNPKKTKNVKTYKESFKKSQKIEGEKTPKESKKIIKKPKNVKKNQQQKNLKI